MKSAALLLCIIVATLLLSFGNSIHHCKEAVYWMEMYKKADSCIVIMDFKTQEAKDRVLQIHWRMYDLTIKQK